MDVDQIEVRAIEPRETLEIRSAVLHPGSRAADCAHADDLLPTSAHFGVFQGQRLVGVCTLYHEAPPDWSGETSWRIRDMAVRTDLHGLGFGRALLDVCTAHVDGRDGTVLWCYARETGTGFYLRHGFRTETEMREIAGLGPRVLMLREEKAALP